MIHVPSGSLEACCAATAGVVDRVIARSGLDPSRDTMPDVARPPVPGSLTMPCGGIDAPADVPPRALGVTAGAAGGAGAGAAAVVAAGAPAVAAFGAPSVAPAE